MKKFLVASLTLIFMLCGVFTAGCQKEYHYYIDDSDFSLVVALNDDVDDVENLEDLYWNELKNALDGALENINKSRKSEGERLAKDIHSRLDKISEIIPIVEEASKKLLEEYKTKLENRIAELGANEIVDESRLGVEIVLFADKSSICEEITRLKSHIESFKEMLNAEGPIGKKIDFLIQEMNRETNTIGSKANSLGITKHVIEMKNELENIREQIQNIE